MGTAEEIAEVVRPAVLAAGLDLWDVERSGGSVRVMVDRPGGVDLDAISTLSRAVSRVLDQHDELVPTGHYMLEVSSPGLERRLRLPEHFARYIGALVAVKTTEPVNGRRRLEGALLGCSAESVTLRVETRLGGQSSSAVTEELTIPLRIVERARTVFNWGATAGSRTSRGPEAGKVAKSRGTANVGLPTAGRARQGAGGHRGVASGAGKVESGAA
ncbi:MAG: ribosome maturation factor RimP [Acidimicrobiales bacterium]